MWRSFWDATFGLASTLAPLLLGAALGNVLRGVPLGPEGWFALPLFESWSPRGALGILDWYTVLCGLTALAAIGHHGALFLAWKTDGAVRERSLAAAARLFPATVALWLASTVATAWLAPRIFRGLQGRPLAWLATALFLGGLALSFAARRAGRDLAAFLGSCAFLLGVLAATAASVYPVWLKSTVDPAFSLTATGSAAGATSLRAGLLWWPVGLLLAILYTGILFRLHRGKARAAAEGEGY
jgi:cytochrome d ubiquinol oxidase subunit II